MKLKQNKIIQKIALIAICLISFNFIVPIHVSHAEDVGGVLFSPIKKLFQTIGDVVMMGLDYAVTGDLQGVVKESILNGEVIDIDDKVDMDNFEQEDIIDLDSAKKSDTNIWSGNDDNVDLPRFKVSPDAIFRNEIELLNIDFINEVNESKYDVSNEKTTSALKSLRKNIANWYVAIRNLALVIMLSILVYVGIKIIISSTASDKAKYKQMLMDWVIGMCLMFMLHYMMAFTIMITEQLTNLISESTSKMHVMELKDDDKKNVYLVFKKDYGGHKEGEVLKSVDSLMKYVRLYVQLLDGKKSMVFLFIYAILIIFTVRFAFIYVKRVITIAFLTMIAPFVAMTYPIDKMNDGKAQAFNMWIKEYIYNALIQPMHLILYTVLVGSATELAESNMIFPIIAIGFLIPAEKLLKKMFGFDRAQTPPGLGGAVAAGAASGIANKLLSKGKNAVAKGGNGGNGGNGGPANPSTSNIRTRDGNYDFSGLDKGQNGNDNLLAGSDENSNHDYGSKTLPEEERPAIATATDGSMALDESRIGSQDNLSDNTSSIRTANDGSIALDEGIGVPSQSHEQNRDNLKPNKRLGSNLGAAIKKRTTDKIRRAVTLDNGKRMVKNGGKSAIRMAGRLAGATAGAAVFGAVGAIAAASTGDFSKFSTITAAGAALGGQTGGKAGNAFANATGGFINDVRHGVDGSDERKAYEREQAKKSFISENKNYFAQKTGLSGSELKDKMQTAADLWDSGVGDKEDVMNTMNLMEEYKKQGMNDKNAYEYAKLSGQMMQDNDIKSINFKTDKGKHESAVKSIVRETDPAMNEKEVDAMSKQFMWGNQYLRRNKKNNK